MVRGRLGEVTDEGFMPTVGTTGKAGQRKVAFQEVKSIKVDEGKARGFGHVGVGVLVGLGALLLVSMIVTLAGGAR